MDSLWLFKLVKGQHRSNCSTEPKLSLKPESLFMTGQRFAVRGRLLPAKLGAMWHIHWINGGLNGTALIYNCHLFPEHCSKTQMLYICQIWFLSTFDVLCTFKSFFLFVMWQTRWQSLPLEMWNHRGCSVFSFHLQLQWYTDFLLPQTLPQNILTF